jgi:hypothetical protein
MKRILIPLILCFTFKLYAQQTDSSKKWEMGVDLLPLINKNKLPDKSIFVRYHIKDRNRAWRFR